MSDATADFFEELDRRAHIPLLAYTSGTLRFELVNGGRKERWFVTLDRGDVAVSRKTGGADCVVHASKELFDEVVSGRVNAMAALLRGELVAEGDPNLLVRLQRLFPSPPAGQ
jgi:putative sterol carrier protein